MDTIRPFENEEESLQIGDLTVENRLDRISLYGNLDLTKDKAGLEKARQLKQLLDETVRALESVDLPDAVDSESPSHVPNPFR
jgi:hypothetical protein